MGCILFGILLLILKYYEHLSMLTFIDLQSVPLQEYRIEEFISSPITDISVIIDCHKQYLVNIFVFVYIIIQRYQPKWVHLTVFLDKFKFLNGDKSHIISSSIYKIFSEHKVSAYLLIHDMLFYVINITLITQ